MLSTPIVVDKTKEANAVAAIAKQAFDEICGGCDFAKWHETRDTTARWRSSWKHSRAATPT